MPLWEYNRFPLPLFLIFMRQLGSFEAVQGLTKRWSPGCVNAAGKAAGLVSNSRKSDMLKVVEWRKGR